MTVAVEAPERMASLTAILRSESDRSGLGACGLDTVAFRFRPGWPELIDRLLLNAPHRSSGGTVIFSEKPGGIVCAVINGVLRVEGRRDPLLTGDKESWDLRPASDVYLGEQAARRVVEHWMRRTDPDDPPLRLPGRDQMGAPAAARSIIWQIRRVVPGLLIVMPW